MLPTSPLRMLHGDGAADFMLARGIRGGAFECVWIGPDLSPSRTIPIDYSRHAAAGIEVYLRWELGWASADGGLGCLPADPAQDDAFADLIIRSIRASKGASGHIGPGNEWNSHREWPRNGGPLSAARIARVNRRIWDGIRTGDRFSPPAVDPTTVDSGDPLRCFADVITLMGARKGGGFVPEFYALHAYSRGSGDDPASRQTFGPGPLSYMPFGFGMWRPFARWLYSAGETGKPLIISECNHLTRRDGSAGWDLDAAGWMERVTANVIGFNDAPGGQYIHKVGWYRHAGDAWTMPDPCLDAFARLGETAVTQPVASGFDAPVGTPEERAGSLVWPGAWVDATGFGTWYGFGQFHTGADLNLNAPTWDADAHAPVYAVADGRVTYTGQPSWAWQTILVVEHRLPDGSLVYARHGHVEDLAVGAGDVVRRGQIIAHIGRNGLSSGVLGPYHHHFDISPSGVLRDNPAHWPGADQAALLANYVDPAAWIRSHRPQ